MKLWLHENTAHHNAVLDDANKWTELILSTCTTETRFANCPDYFRATVGP
jgi:hypothetical protein